MKGVLLVGLVVLVRFSYISVLGIMIKHWNFSVGINDKAVIGSKVLGINRQGG